MTLHRRLVHPKVCQNGVPKLCPNSVYSSYWGCCFQRKQIPQFVVNIWSPRERMESLEAARLPGKAGASTLRPSCSRRGRSVSRILHSSPDKKTAARATRRESQETRRPDQFVFPLPDRLGQNRRLHTTKDTAEPRTQSRLPR